MSPHLTSLPPLLLALSLTLLSLLPLTHGQNLNVYHFPSCAQSCAYNVYPTGCIQTDDSCICANTPYLNTIAHCIGLSCNAAGLAASADVFISDCAASGASFAMSKQQFIAAGDGNGGGAAPSSSGFVTSMVASSATADGGVQTSTSPATPTETGTGGGKGLTLDQRIALGCGIGIGLPGTLAAIVTCLCARRR